MMPRVAIQGIEGSFHHRAVRMLFGEEVRIVPCRYFDEVTQSLADGRSDYALMAIENSRAGAILPNYMLIDEARLWISGEVYLPITHQLMAPPGIALDDIREVWSHPMALLQCNGFFRENPHIRRVEYEDTAAAARDVARSGRNEVAVIAPRLAAQMYGLHILRSDIQDRSDNTTRFVLLQRHKEVRPDADKVSLRLETTHRPGSLMRILEILHRYGWNMTKLQSLPIPERPWEYRFFIDALFPDPGVFDTVIDLLRHEAVQLKILGIYPNQNL